MLLEELNTISYLKTGLHFRLLLLLLCFVSYIELQAQANMKGLPFVRTFTTEEYKGGIQNWDITQGASDLIYVANNFGLLVYDGVQWDTVSIEEATRLISVTYGQKDVIYTGGQGDFGYLEATSNGLLAFTSLKGKLSPQYQSFDQIWKIYTIDKAVYFCTFKYIFKLEGQDLEVIDPEVELGFSFMVRNQFFTHIPAKGLMKLEGEKFEPVEGGEVMRGKDVRGIVPLDKYRNLVATRDHGLFLMDREGIVSWALPYKDWLMKAQINSILLLSSNQFAIGTQNNGILIIDQDGEIDQFLTDDRGLANQSVLSLFEDRFGNLWAGLNNGIALIELGQPFSLINDGLELSGTGYTAIKSGESVYLGTNNGLFTLKSSTSNKLPFPQYKKVPGTNGQTYSLQILEKDLILGHHNGAFMITENQSVPIPIGEQGVWKIEKIPSADNQFIAGGYTGMYLLEKTIGGWKLVKKYKGFSESSRKFELINDTTIWMSHGYKGVYKLQFSKDFGELIDIKFYKEEDGLPSNLLNNVFKVENRLVFTAKKGVYQYNPSTDRFEKDPILSPYFEEQHIRELEEDVLGNLYFLADDEVGLLKKNALKGYTKETKSFQKILPFVSDDLENITVLDQENILFNAKEGFINYNSNLNNTGDKPFSTLFRLVTWGDSIVFGGYPKEGGFEMNNKKSTVTLPYTRDVVSFHYASVFFEVTSSSQYQYWLENFEADWSKWTLQTAKEYTNLPAGEYSFHVRSRNSEGILSSESVFHFKVLPPWYRSKTAYTIYVFVFVFFLSFGWILIDKRYRKKQRHFVDNANKVIQEKENRLQEATFQSEKEITQLKNERLEAELKHKNRELASSAMHLITKNEFMYQLKSDINQLLKEGDGQKLTRGLKRVVKVIDKNIAEDGVWEQFEIHFDEVHGDFTKKLRKQYPNLTPQDLKLSAFLRMNMSSKEIAHLLNISVRGVEISRYRLRKKLPISSNENLVEFMMNIS